MRLDEFSRSEVAMTDPILVERSLDGTGVELRCGQRVVVIPWTDAPRVAGQLLALSVATSLIEGVASVQRELPPKTATTGSDDTVRREWDRAVAECDRVVKRYGAPLSTSVCPQCGAEGVAVPKRDSAIFVPALPWVAKTCVPPGNGPAMWLHDAESLRGLKGT